MENNSSSILTDDTIRQNILYRLQHDPAIDSTKIEVEVKSGIAILKGKIDTQTEKELCEKIARETEGISGVENHLHIEAGIAHALSNLAAHIQGDIIKDTEED
jgi:osmotically-inducible protein OsmY